MTDAHPHASIRYWTIGEWREAKIAAAVRADDGFDPEVLEWARRRLRGMEAARMKPGQIRPHTMPRRWWEFWR